MLDFAFIALFFLVFNNVKNDDKIIELNTSLTQEQGSTERHRQDSINKEKARNVVALHKDYSIDRNAEGILSLFADTLDRYYMTTNRPAEDIKNSMGSYWKKFPDERSIYERSEFIVDIMPDLTFYVTVPSTYYKR